MNDDQPNRQRRQRNPMVKAMRTLNWMVHTGESSWGVREIARALEVPPSTAFRSLSLLEDADVVIRDHETGRYELTLGFYRLASRAALGLPLRAAALPQLEELTDLTGEAAYLGVYDRHQRKVMYIVGVDSRHPVQYMLTRFEWIELVAGAGGMGVLSFLPEHQRERVLRESKLQRFTDRTITSRAELRSEIAKIREQGYCISVSRHIRDAVGISAPIRGPDESVVGVIVLAFPESRLPNYDLDALGRGVVNAARVTSERLGWSESAPGSTAERLEQVPE